MRPSASGAKKGRRPPETRLRTSAVMKTVLPDRDRPVTPSRTAGVRYPDKRSCASLKRSGENAGNGDRSVKGAYNRKRGPLEVPSKWPICRRRARPPAALNDVLAVEHNCNTGCHNSQAHQHDSATSEEFRHDTPLSKVSMCARRPGQAEASRLWREHNLGPLNEA